MIVPMAAQSAIPEPEIPEMIMQDRMATLASPPRQWPTSVSQKRTSWAVMPASVISSPVSTKSGIASSG